jgi:DNA-binding XRE family transcriptional regulator
VQDLLTSLRHTLCEFVSSPCDLKENDEAEASDRPFVPEYPTARFSIRMRPPRIWSCRAAFSFHRPRTALDLDADEIPPGVRRPFCRGRPVVVWPPPDGLAFSIGLDQRYGCSPTDFAKARRSLSGAVQLRGTDGWTAYRRFRNHIRMAVPIEPARGRLVPTQRPSSRMNAVGPPFIWLWMAVMKIATWVDRKSLEAARRLLGLNVHSAAKFSGLSATTIIRIEAGGPALVSSLNRLRRNYEIRGAIFEADGSVIIAARGDR